MDPRTGNDDVTEVQPLPGYPQPPPEPTAYQQAPPPPGPSWPQPTYAQQPGYPPLPAYPGPAGAMTAPSTGAARPVAATFVLVGSLLFLWYTVGVAVQLGVSALQPSHYREAGPVFGVAAVLCLVLALWLRGSRAKVAGVVVTLVGVGLLTFALWSRRADWHFLAGSLPVAGAVFVLIGGLAGLRTVR